jgi:hypothetical protein
MPSDIKKLAESLRKPGASPDATMKALLQAVEALSGLVKLLLLDKQLGDLAGKVESLTGTGLGEHKPFNEADLSTEVVDNLEEVATSRTKDGKTEFLLHRLTGDFEYQKSQDGNEYKTGTDTDWSAEFGVTDLKQDRSEATLKGANPAVSCWIPKDAIKGIRGAQDNTGQWGELGENPHKNHYCIVVKPGKYEIYQELRQ